MDPGDLVGGRFRIAEQIGRGGMGIVFRAVDETTHQPVAIKVFAWRDAVEVQRGRQEVELLAQLRHPAIVAHVADGMTDAGELFLAMQWVDGMTVADRLDGEGFSVREAVDMAYPIAEALAVAHAANVLHRDVKPTNVLLAGNLPREAKLIDFGIARVVDGVKALTRTGTAIGTPGYMSPEQARGEKVIGPASDVFGLGCLLYECITGRPAFSGSQPAAVMTKILLATPAAVANACPEAPRDLVSLIDRMLAKRIENRLPDCSAVLAELDKLGPIPDGPRRGTRSLATATAPSLPKAAQVPQLVDAHCIVGAARGSPDDPLDPPTAEEERALHAAADRQSAVFQVVATGAVMAHLFGQAKPTATRAATLALEFRRILPRWTITISGIASEADRAVDDGARQLTGAAMAAIFRKGKEPAIVVDPQTAALLADDFVLAPGAEPQLVGPRQR